MTGLSVLQRAVKADVRSDPFPYLVVENALPEDLYESLARSFPAPADLGVAIEGSNRRWDFSTRDVLRDGRLEPVWRDFIAYHASEAFFQELIALFGDEVRRLYPDRFPTLRRLEQLRPGVRGIDDFFKRNVLMDAQISGNTPVQTANSVRPSHVDDGRKLYSGLFYMRLDGDDSLGGDLTISRFKPSCAGSQRRFGFFKDSYVDDDHLDLVEMVPYAKNKLVLFINSLDSLHGVTVRHPTAHPRRFVNLIGEVDPPLYRQGDKGCPATYLHGLSAVAYSRRLPKWASEALVRRHRTVQRRQAKSAGIAG